jgi:O-antigen ligase
MACDIRLASVFIIAFAVFWLLEGGIGKKFSAFLHNKYALLFVLFYVIHLVGLMYSYERHAGLFELQVKLSLLLFPVMLVSEGEMDFKRQKLFIISFVAGLVLGGLICISYATWRYFALHVSIFHYMGFSIFHHPSYYSMYIDIAFVMVFYVLTKVGSNLKRWEKIFLFSSSIFLVFMLILLESKTGMIVSAIVFLVLLAKFSIQSKSVKLRIALVSGTIITCVLIYSFADSSRFSSAFNILSSKQMDTKSTESTQARFFVWQSAWKVIQTAPFTGVGTGDTRYALTEQYAKDNFTGAEKERLNAHNEYLETTVELGVGGLACLLACLFIPLYKSIKEQRFVYLMLLVILIINFLTESMLETQGGTIFYGLFNSLLMFNFVI